MKPKAISSPADSWRRRELVYDSFEQAWEDHGDARIEDHLPPPESPQRVPVLHELIKIDLEHRWARGQEVRVEEYAQRFPEVAASGAMPLFLIVEEVRVRRLVGRTPILDELQSRFPGRNDELQQALADEVPSKTGERSDQATLTAAAPMTASAAQRTHLGRYELREQVGRGGFAAVYRAWDAELRRQVAIKVPREELLLDDDFRSRVIREARSAARLRHHAIVPLHEVGQDGLTTWLVYEFIEGSTLAQHLRQTRPSPGQAAQWVAILADALEYAHQAGIVHRDIKPANVMMRNDGQPVLTDFGLALHTESASTLTQHGEILGTPAYMSPEQAGGKSHDVDARTDVYSLGVLLYEAISGQVPFPAASPAILHQVIHDDPTPPRHLRADIPVDLETICLKAMAKEPGQRYQTAGALAEDLRRYLAHQPIRARRTSPMGKLVRWSRRKPALAATLAVAILTVSLVGAFSWYRVLQERDLFRLERDRAQSLAAKLASDRGLNLCEQGEIGPGLLWLIRSLELTANGTSAQQRALRMNLGAWGARLAFPIQVFSHGAEVRGLAFDSHHRTLYTAGSDGRVCRWDIRSSGGRRSDLDPGREVRQALQTPMELSAVAVSPDGKAVFAGGMDSKVYAWQLGSPRLKGSATSTFRPGGDIFGLAYHPKQATILAGLGLQPSRLLDAATGKDRFPALQHGGWVRCVAFSPDGGVALTGGDDGATRLWETATGKLLASLPHPRSVGAIAVSLDGRCLATGCGDNKVRLWDFPTRKTLYALEHHGSVTGVAFSATGELLLTGSRDRMARLWHVKTGVLLCPPLQHPAPVTSVAFVQSDREGSNAAWAITGCSDGLVRLWQLPPERTQSSDLIHDATVWAAVYSQDGRQVLTGCGENGRDPGSAQLWDLANGGRRGPALTHRDLVKVVALSRDARFGLTGGWDHAARLWDARSGALLATIDEGSGVSAVAFSPDGQAFVTGIQGPVAADRERHKSLKFWNAATRQPTGLALRHEQPVRSLAFSDDGKWILTGSYDRTARLWELPSGTPVGPPMQHQGGVGAAALSPDSRRAATGTDDHGAHIWDLANGNAPLFRLPHKGTVRAVAFSPDGNLLLTGSWDKTARLWDPVTGTAIGPAMVHGAEVETAAFHPDGKSLLTGGWDKRVRFWNVPTAADGSEEHLRVWIEVLTCQELAAGETLRLLDSESWRQRRQQLAQVGGSPAIVCR